MFKPVKIAAKHILGHLPDAIVVANVDGDITYLNSAAQQLLSYPLAEAKQHTISDVVCLVNERSDEAISCIAMKALCNRHTEMAGEHCLLLARDGLTELPVEAIATPLFDKKKHLIGVALRLRDVRLARFSHKQLSWHSSHDALTGLYNRAEFEQHCQRLLLTAKRDKVQHVLLLIDIDYFRQLNELAGSQYGDECLLEVSQLLSSLLRATDHLSRNHSDQFFILLSHCQLDRAEKIADNLRQQIAQIQLDIDHGVWPVTASIGITAINEDSPDDVLPLVHEAESALFDAKQAGRNTVSRYNSATHQQLNHEILNYLAGMHNGDFRLYYQQIDSPQGLNSICEVLLRYYDVDGHAKTPKEFIPLFEKSGLITQLDLWVVQQVLENLFSNRQVLTQFERIHLNLSAYSFASDDFLESIEALLRNHPVPKGLLCFEVSEASILHNLAHTEKVMNRLSKLGCLFVVDDVDANLSAFQRLLKLPIHSIKIDGELVQQISQSVYSTIIIESIIELAKEAKLEIIAQQVEDFLIYDWLQHREVDYVQGFILHEPKPL